MNNIVPGGIETPINAALLNEHPKLSAELPNISLEQTGQTAGYCPSRRFPRFLSWRTALELLRTVAVVPICCSFCRNC